MYLQTCKRTHVGCGTGVRSKVIETLYFCMVTLTTVGYGDNPPLKDSNALMLFTSFFVLHVVLHTGSPTDAVCRLENTAGCPRATLQRIQRIVIARYVVGCCLLPAVLWRC